MEANSENWALSIFNNLYQMGLGNLQIGKHHKIEDVSYIHLAYWLIWANLLRV